MTTKLLVFTAILSASAGTITGKVSGAKGASVVYIDAIPGVTSFRAPAEPVEMDQKNLTFQPHLVAILKGTTMVFKNSDQVQHSVFWPSISGDKKLAHDLGVWNGGDTRSYKFETPGVVPVMCKMHAEMLAYIVVCPTPFFAKTDDAGSFSIGNVPNGKYSVTFWHEGFKPQTQQVTVAGDVKADFTLSK